MSKRDVIQSHLEALAERMLEVDELRVEPSGSIGIVHRSALYKLRVLGATERPHVEVFAIAVDDVDADPGLYEALNSINRAASHFRAFWTERKVVFATEMVGESLDYLDLECACEEIATAAHREGRRLAQVYGGSVAFPDYEPDGEDE